MGLRGKVYRLGTHQSAAFTTVANSITNAVATGTDVVRVVTTKGAYVKIGASPTAAATDVYMAADSPEYFVVTPGMKVSAIRVATNGALHVTEVTG